MIPRDLEELVLADSVGALDADERAELEARLGALSLEESMQLAQLYETAAALAMAVNTLEPPAYLRERVRSEIQLHVEPANRGSSTAVGCIHRAPFVAGSYTVS